jgi:hypothetical protein
MRELLKAFSIKLSGIKTVALLEKNQIKEKKLLKSRP